MTITKLASGQPITPPTLPDRHAAALAEVSAMKDLITEQKRFIDDYRRIIMTMNDRIALLTEERARWRSDALACRTFVTKLATILEHVHTATTGAAAILDDMAKMDAGETPKAAVDQTTQEIEERLHAMKEKIDGATVASVSGTTPPHDAGELRMDRQPSQPQREV